MKVILTYILVSLLSALSMDAAEPNARLYELRTYQAQPGKLETLLQRFRDPTAELFTKHGIKNVAYWVPSPNPSDQLIYLISFADRDAREASFKAFGEDPVWRAAYGASEANGSVVKSVTSLFLEETNFSPGFQPTDKDTPRLFEMRIYQAPADRLTNLHSRFRDHTLELFEKHRITNHGYFSLTPNQPEADTQLVYFISHKDQQSAEASWEAFKADPAWIRAKLASEKEAGGSLTVPDGIKSLFLAPTDFSPVQ